MQTSSGKIKIKSNVARTIGPQIQCVYNMQAQSQMQQHTRSKIQQPSKSYCAAIKGRLSVNEFSHV